nr:MAG TPA: hypothetical protein [Caudoviricetes sp.]
MLTPHQKGRRNISLYNNHYWLFILNISRKQ